MSLIRGMPMGLKKNTIQRSLVLATVNKLQNHATADEIYMSIAHEHPTISRGTVYRNLKYLAEENAIKKIEVLGGADRFDHLCDEHYHARCLQCGRIFNLNMVYIPHLEKKVKDTQGFTLSGYDLMFKGICPECKKK